MEINQKLCNNAYRKVALLVTKASDLGMDLSCYGVADENQTSGNVYLWLEDYPFTLYIDLGSDDINACFTDVETGEEEVLFNIADKDLSYLMQWCDDAELKLYNQRQEA
jgi:hypothetical protein